VASLSSESLAVRRSRFRTSDLTGYNTYILLVLFIIYIACQQLLSRGHQLCQRSSAGVGSCAGWGQQLARNHELG